MEKCQKGEEEGRYELSELSSHIITNIITTHLADVVCTKYQNLIKADTIAFEVVSASDSAH